MQLVIFATAIAVVLIFFVGVYPLNYAWRRAFAITVVLIAAALFVLVTTVRDKLKHRNVSESR